MSAEVTTTQVQVIAPEGPKTTKTTVHFNFTCDGPKCGKPDSACKGTLEWSESTDVKESHVPDEFYRLINFKVGPGQPLDFFSRECLRDYMRTYVPPLSPREEAAKAMNNGSVQKTDESVEIISTPAAYSHPDSDATGVKE
jgi:hypothetical protein